MLYLRFSFALAYVFFRFHPRWGAVYVGVKLVLGLRCPLVVLKVVTAVCRFFLLTLQRYDDFCKLPNF